MDGAESDSLPVLPSRRCESLPGQKFAVRNLRERSQNLAEESLLTKFETPADLISPSFLRSNISCQHFTISPWQRRGEWIK